MEAINSLKMYLRLAAGLRGLARQRLTLDDAREIIKRRLERREANFLLMLRQGIFGYAQSPYIQLMKLAGCEYGDIENEVNSRGLEPVLTSLRKAGVYVTYEEFKGRTPIVRGNQTIPVNPKDFENPFLKVDFQIETGGLSGAGRRIPMELDYQSGLTPMMIVTRQAHGCLDSPTAIWRGPIPDGSGINRVVNMVGAGRPPEKWFVADLRGKDKPRLSYRLADWCFVNGLKMFNVPMPRQEPLAMDQAHVLAKWTHDMCQQHGSCYVVTPVGRAMRVCIAAREAGLDLSGAVFELGGEPTTEAKGRVINAAKALYYASYNMYEFGQMAKGCANPNCSDDMHMFTDCFGLISHPIAMPQNGAKVNALNITSLLPTAPMMMLNAQVDDHGLVEQRSCGCALERLGYTQHVSQISSYSKLVTEGVSLIGSDVVRILEEVLPSHFGGSPMDYQLQEEEDQKGMTRLNLAVHPRIQLRDEGEIIKVFMQALEKGPDSYTWARGIWSQGRILRVRRMVPKSSDRGKHLTLLRGK